MNTNGSSLNGGNGKHLAAEEARLDITAENVVQRQYDVMIPVDQGQLDRDTADSPSINDLRGIAMDALRIWPPLLISSILGRPWTWIPPYRRFSEFKILNLWRLRRTIKYLVNVNIPSIPRRPPPFGPPFLNSLFWQPSVILQRPDHYGSYTTFPDESWFLINGIMTNDSLAQLNAAYVSYLFHRPVTLVQNATNSFSIDMLQCMIGKEWAATTEPAMKAFPILYDALKSPHKRKVVIIAHSQGTIIMATLLRLLYALNRREEPGVVEALELAGAEAYAPPEIILPDDMEVELRDFEKLSKDELAKLEIYNFATCANIMQYSGLEQEGRPLPWIEHFGNEYDIVARLGMQAPNPDKWGIKIEGPRYVRAQAWGHFLNAHYLFGIEDAQKVRHKRGGSGTTLPYELANPEAGVAESAPRLFGYLNGGVS
jgi:hypothetical protein